MTTIKKSIDWASRKFWLLIVAIVAPQWYVLVMAYTLNITEGWSFARYFLGISLAAIISYLGINVSQKIFFEKPIQMNGGGSDIDKKPK